MSEFDLPSALLEAIATVYRASFRRLERNLCRSTTGGTSRGEALARLSAISPAAATPPAASSATISTATPTAAATTAAAKRLFRLPLGPAVRAALRLIGEATLRVPLLIGRGVDEGCGTVNAGDGLVFEIHVWAFRFVGILPAMPGHEILQADWPTDWKGRSCYRSAVHTHYEGVVLPPVPESVKKILSGPSNAENAYGTAQAGVEIRFLGTVGWAVPIVGEFRWRENPFSHLFYQSRMRQRPTHRFAPLHLRSLRTIPPPSALSQQFTALRTPAPRSDS